MPGIEVEQPFQLTGAPPESPAAREALRAWLPRGLDALYRYIYVRIGFDKASADDVLQQTIFEALRHRDAPREPAAQEWWLRGIARNLMRRHWRQARRNAGCVPIDGNGGADAVLASLSRADDHAAHEEARCQLLGAISSLSADEQWLLYEFYRHGRTRAEIGQMLGVTAKSVQSKLYRLRQRLRDRLGEPTGVEP